MIVVIPDGWTSYGCGQWVDSPVSGNFEHYVTDDVVAQIDSEFRTIPAATSRGVFGHSSGGFGAWHLASRNPSVFAAMAMISGDSFFDLTMKTVVYDYLNEIWPGEPSGPIEGDELSQLTYACAASYSPNVDAPFLVDLPIAQETGETIEAVWNRWLSFDPVVNFQERIDKLKQLSGILLDVGINDEVKLQWGHRLLSHRLRSAGIAHDVNENEGSHSGRSRERVQVSLRWMAGILVHDR